nr:hypothetical protein [Tanacetum cinerariifolium]
MNLLNGSCNNCIYGDGKPVTCSACEGMLRGGFCLPCDLKEKNSYNCDPNVYSFNNSNYLPQHQFENYLCNLCGNNSHDGYDCQQQFLFVYKQKPSYNQNYNDNYYPHESPSFPCCDNCGGSHETFRCQPIDQNIDFSGSDQIQTPQCPDVHPPSQEKLLEDLKELAEYDNSPSRDRPIFFDNDEDHSDQEKEHLENPSNEIDASNSNQGKEKPPQDSDIQTESDEIIKSGVEKLVPIPREYKVTLDNKSEVTKPVKDDSSAFTTSTNPFFNDSNDVTSNDKESVQDIPIEESKIHSNPLFENDEIYSDDLESHVESNLVESIFSHDSLIDSS